RGLPARFPPPHLCVSCRRVGGTKRLRRTPRGIGEPSFSMGWRRGELWLDTELWMPEGIPVPAVVGVPFTSIPDDALPPGLAASRRRREAWGRDRRARKSRASAIALSPAVVFALAALQADGRQRRSFAAEDPPSLTFRFDNGVVEPLKFSSTRPKHAGRRAHGPPKIAWHHATSVGVPYGGSLAYGTQLPLRGPDWITWNPSTDSVPNAPKRL